MSTNPTEVTPRTLLSQSVRIIVGDSLTVLKTLPSESVHCCVTSPPYWGLRDYQKDGQIGAEKSIHDYAAGLVAVFREVRRVLRRDGTLWLNIGDTYTGGGRGGGGSYSGERRSYRRDGATVTPRLPSSVEGLPRKSMAGVPWRVAFALQDDGWLLRQDIIWHKTNAMPGSTHDRCVTAHEYVFLLSKQEKYYWDWFAVQETGVDTPTRLARSVWRIPTRGFSGAHFAAYPPALVDRCIRAGAPMNGVCAACGSPRVRVVESQRTATRLDAKTKADGRHSNEVGKRAPKRHLSVHNCTGWRPSCECGAECEPATVLDPFLGSGTTAMAASRIGMRSIGIELNPEYAELARAGMERG